MPSIKGFLKTICLITIFLVLFLYYHFSSNAPVTTGEMFRQDEPEQTERSIKNFIAVIEQNKTGYAARGAHAKGHACVKAYFDIRRDVQPDLQHGVFSMPGTRYKAWIRFSNGASSMKGNHDANKDARGMAVKLINIADDVPINAEAGPATQDFLMHDSPVFFVENIEDYNQFVESDNKILYFVSDINPFKWKLRELRQGLATLKSPPASPLWTQYFSNTAYKLGRHNIKFSAQSCGVPADHSDTDRDDPDFLRKRMARALQTANACFDFMVQLQNPEKYMPVEDPSIEWKTSDSPFIKLAVITIPMQEFDTVRQQTFCESLSFSPWNSLAEHRPIGQLNRIRKRVYQASSEYRHLKNNVAAPTHLDW